MPELPEVETFRLQTESTCLGKTVVKIKTSGLMTCPTDNKMLASVTNLKLTDTFRHGKYLFIEFDGNPKYLIFHFGMSGSFKFDKSQNSRSRKPAYKHCHIELCFSDNTRLSFIDPRRFGSVGTVTPEAKEQLISNLGPDAASPKFNFEYLKEVTHRRSSPIKTLLLDQHLIAGLGNIYANEILFASGILPNRKAGSLSEAELRRLVKDCKSILKRAILERGSTLSDKGYSDIHGSKGSFQRLHNCYGLDGTACKTCDETIVKTLIGNRSTFYCPKCQI